MDQRLVLEFQSSSNMELLGYAYQPGVYTNDVVLAAQQVLLCRTLNKQEEDYKQALMLEHRIKAERKEQLVKLPYLNVAILLNAILLGLTFLLVFFFAFILVPFSEHTFVSLSFTILLLLLFSLYVYRFIEKETNCI